MTGEPPEPGSYPQPPSSGPPQRGIPESELYRDAYPAPAASEAPLTYIGDIGIGPTQVMTPAGTLPLRGSVWTVTDMSRTEEYMPTYAVVLAIIFFIFCLLGLLFLLMKATRTVGFVSVSVSGGGRYHSTMVPVFSPAHVQHVLNQVNWARSMAAQA